MLFFCSGKEKIKKVENEKLLSPGISNVIKKALTLHSFTGWL